MQSIHKRNDLNKKVTALSSLIEITASMKKMDQVNPNLAVLSSVSAIARHMATEKKIISAASILNSSALTKYESFAVAKNNYALAGLTSSLAVLAIKNPIASDKLANAAISQLTATSYMSQLAQATQNSHLNKFNALNAAYQGISNNYLKQTAQANTWKEVEIAELANDTIINLTDKTLNQKSIITKDDLEEFRISLFLELSSLLSKTKSKLAISYIINLMTVLGWILSFYSSSKTYSDISNRDLLAENEQMLKAVKSDASDQINIALQKLNKTRIARANVNLRFSAKKKSKKIGLVKEGQIVNVIEIQHKFLLIAYLDFETNEPISGFVAKKYFKEIE